MDWGVSFSTNDLEMKRTCFLSTESIKMEGKAAKMRERFVQRQEARMAELQKKKDSASYRQPDTENVDHFTKTFAAEMGKISEQLEKLEEGLGRPVLTEQFDELLLSLKNLQKFVTDSAIFLPSYELRQSQENLLKMHNMVIERRDGLLPKKKFTFKSRTKKAPLASKIANSEECTNLDEKVNKDSKAENESPSKAQLDEFGFSNKKDLALMLTSEESRHKDIKLSNLENCTVRIYGYPSAIHVSNLKNSKVLCGPVCRATFVTDCENCQFTLACQQLRIHATKNTTFSIHVTGKAIIEDCSEVGFAPYNWSYQELSEHFKDAGLNIEINKWNDVDDFNWLKLNEQSPNWHIVPQEKRFQIEET